MRPGKRLFVGVRISVAASNALAGCAETLARRARDAGVDLKWVAPANYHVTLAFLGWTGLEAIGRVCDALAAATAGESRTTFRTARLGAFPSLDRASVLWAGIEDGAALTGLARSIGAAMAGLGFERSETGARVPHGIERSETGGGGPDGSAGGAGGRAPRGIERSETGGGKPFHPHVTIARLRTPRAIREIVLPMAEQMFGDTRIDAVTLFESDTKSTGSVYREVRKMAFERAAWTPSEPPKRQTGALERGIPDREPDDTLTDDGWPRGQGPTE